MQPIERVREAVRDFTPYAPGLSMDEIKERYGLTQVIKLASNENPLGASPLVKRVLARKADTVFRYPRAGNPALVAALAAAHGVPAGCVVVATVRTRSLICSPGSRPPRVATTSWPLIRVFPSTCSRRACAV